MIRANVAQANRSIEWCRFGDACLPYYRYGNDSFAIPIDKLDVFFTCYNPEKTPSWERGELRNEGKELWY